MDPRNLEALAIFVKAFENLEEKRKALPLIEKKMLEDIAQCKKRIEEVKLKKKRVPLYTASASLTITSEESQTNATKDYRRRGRRKAAEKAIARNTACSKITLKTKLRKRKSDDDLHEDQPLNKLRKDVTIVPAVQPNTPKKDKTYFMEKKTLLTTIHNEEKQHDNILVGSNTILINSITVVHKTVSKQNDIIEELNEKNKPSEINDKDGVQNQNARERVSEKVDKSDDTLTTNIEQLVNCKNATVNKSPISKELEEKAVLESSVNGVIEIADSSFKKETDPSKDKTIKNSFVNKSTKRTKSTSDLSKASDCEMQSPNEEENTVKNNSVSDSKLNIRNIDKSKEGIGGNKQEVKSKDTKKQKLVPKVGANTFIVPDIIIQSSDEESSGKKRITRSKVTRGKEKIITASSESSSSEVSPVKQRLTRSKMVKGKENKTTSASDDNASAEEKLLPQPQFRMTRSKMAKQAISKTDKMSDNIRSGEESDAVSDVNLCSDGEMGKKRVKDIIKAMNERQAAVLLSPVKLTKEQEKENQHSSILKILHKKDKRTPSVERKYVVTKTTPLQVRNGFITPNKKPIPVISSATRNKTAMEDAEKRRKEEEARRKRQKEEEVLRKKQELLKFKQEEMKKRHEEKMLKVAAMREAAEKEKNECFLKMEKEREEREKMAKAENERKKMEEAIKKKMAYQTKVAEVEIRRQKEEAARLARLKELEEEQRHQEELRQKQLEENERIMKQRQEEEQRAKEALKQKVLYQKELLKKQKANIIPLKDKDNYSISGDLAAGDDDDEDIDEENSKKEFPAWAKKEERLLSSKIQSYYPMDLVQAFFCCPSSSPDLTDIFGKMTIKRIRSSSAVWLDSPPLKLYHPNKN